MEYIDSEITVDNIGQDNLNSYFLHESNSIDGVTKTDGLDEYLKHVGPVSKYINEGFAKIKVDKSVER